MTVLYVEDDIDIIENMVEFIEYQFEKVLTATNGMDALKLFNTHSDIDVIITDINMPKMNGFEFIKEIKKLDKNIPILITSAYSDLDYLIESIKLKVDGYILKPIDISQLISEIDKVQTHLKIKKEFKKNEKLLFEYKQAIDESSIVSKTDTKGIITFVNDAFCKISGYSKDELIGQNHNIVRHQDTSSSVFKIVWETILNKQPWKGVLKNKKKDGGVYFVDTYITPILNEKGEIEEFIAIRNDITLEIEYQNSLEQKVNEQVSKIREQDKLIHRQSKLAAMGEMIDAIAHQWKQPINIIKMRIEMLGYDEEDNKLNKTTLKEFQQNVYHQIDHILTTLDEFRSFLRPTLSPTNFSVTALIQSVQIIMKDELLQNKITLKVDTFADPFIKGNENEFKHVLINLINNSKDAFIENNIQNRKINISISAHQIEFFDNAGGIPATAVQHIFDANFTTKEEGKGTGIGLYISKQIVEKNGATISAQNCNDGAKFLIKF